MSQEQRIAKIKARIEAIDTLIERESKKNKRCRYKYPVSLERLYDRRDRWEEHLVHAELS